MRKQSKNETEQNKMNAININTHTHTHTHTHRQTNLGTSVNSTSGRKFLTWFTAAAEAARIRTKHCGVWKEGEGGKLKNGEKGKRIAKGTIISFFFFLLT